MSLSSQLAYPLLGAALIVKYRLQQSLIWGIDNFHDFIVNEFLYLNILILRYNKMKGISLIFKGFFNFLFYNLSYTYKHYSMQTFCANHITKANNVGRFSDVCFHLNHD